MWVLSLECDRCRKRFDVLLSSDADEIAETVRLMDAEARAGEYSVTVTCRECGEEAADACVVAEEMIGSAEFDAGGASEEGP